MGRSGNGQTVREEGMKLEDVAARCAVAASVMVFCLAVPLRASPHQGAAQDSRFVRALNSPMTTFDAQGRSFAECLITLVYRFGLPGGLEHIDREAAARPLTLKLRNKSVREVITALVAQVPGYQVSFTRNFVEVYSPRARSDPANILNTVIPSYDVDLQTPNVSSFRLFCALAKAAAPSGGCGGSIATGGPATVTLHLRNKRVYEILYEIAGADGETFWTVTVAPERLSAFTSDMWYTYSLDSGFESTVLTRLETLFTGR